MNLECPSVVWGIMTLANQQAGRKSMLRKLVIGALGAMVVMFSTAAFAQGTGAEAKAMLEKAVAAVKADKAKALDMFNKGEGGFLDRDLYPFCFNISDGKIVGLGNPNAKQLLGQDTRTLKDSTGKLFGPEIYASAKEGQVSEVGGYMFPRPGADKTPVPKVSFVTRVGDLGCGVGYYK
jgi:signal transduction histidine kinase